MSTVKVQTETVPANFCFQGFNSSSWNQLVNLLFTQLPDGYSSINFGNTPPAPDLRDAPWMRTNADGTPDRVYAYQNGVWLAPHGNCPGIVAMYEGTENSIKTLDGGADVPITDRTGPFWEKVTSMDAKFPIGPGTTASGTNPVTIAIGGTGGEDEHVLTTAQIPSHNHAIAYEGAAGGSSCLNITTVHSPLYTTDVITAAGGGLAHNNLPPYLGIWFIRRTARLYYTVT